MTFLIQLAWAILISYVVKEFFTPTPQDRATRATMDDVDAPTISEGTAVQVISGSILTSRQNVSLYGGLNSVPIKQEGVTIGYRYSLTVQLSICTGPIDNIREIRFDDIIVPSDKFTRTETADYIDFNINAPDLLGGDDKEGGIVGVMRVYKGTTTQVYDTELPALQGNIVPSAYRRICYVMLRNMYLGTSVRLKQISLLVERCPNTIGLTGNKHVIGTHRDANPVCILHEAMSDPIWGAGIPLDQFDTPAWVAAAETVYAEGLGVSLSLSTAQELDKLVEQMLKYVEGVVYEHPGTGLLTLQLVRDADLTTAPTFSQDDISTVDITRLSWTELLNTTKVTFTDPTRNYETGGVMAQNSAAVLATGAADLEVIDLPGLTSRQNALLAAERALRGSSTALSKVEITGSRRLASLLPGAAFKLIWDRPTISAYYRVTKIDFGSPTDARVVVSAVEDIYSAGQGTFISEGNPWEPAVVVPQPVREALLLELPQYLVRSLVWPLDPTTAGRWVAFGPVTPGTGHVGFRLQVQGTPTGTAIYPFVTVGTLTASLAQWTGQAVLPSLTVTMVAPATTVTSAEYDAGKSLILVGGELMAFRSLSSNLDGTVTLTDVARALLDTVPVAHAAGEPVYLLGTASVERDMGTPDILALLGAQSITATGAQPAYEATQFELQTVSRSLRPLAPAGVKIGGVSYPATAANGALLTWEPRSTATTQLVDQSVTGVTQPSGEQYHIEVWNTGASTLVDSHLTNGLSHTLSLPTAGNYEVTLVSRNSGLDSYQKHSIRVNVA